jgi:hypothetical protein
VCPATTSANQIKRPIQRTRNFKIVQVLMRFIGEMPVEFIDQFVRYVLHCFRGLKFTGNHDGVGFVVHGSVTPDVVVQKDEAIAVLVFGVADFVKAWFTYDEFEIAEFAGLRTAGNDAMNELVVRTSSWRYPCDAPDEGLLVARVLMKLPFQHQSPIQSRNSALVYAQKYSFVNPNESLD